MKFSFAWTFVNKLRGGTPAPPPEKRTPAFPRLPACRALSRQIGKGIFRAMLAVFRTGRRQHLAFGGHVLSPGVPHLAAQQKRHNRCLPYPPPSRKTGLETMDWAAPTARCAPACLRISDWAASTKRACFCLLGGFGYLERRFSTHRGPSRGEPSARFLLSIAERSRGPHRHPASQERSVHRARFPECAAQLAGHSSLSSGLTSRSFPVEA